MDTKTQSQTQLLHQFKEQKSSLFSIPVAIFLAVCVLLGTTTGYFIAKTKTEGIQTINKTNSNNNGLVAVGTIVGFNDLKTFSDIAEGTLQKGGMEEEGEYHLVRKGGPSQNVYLISSSIDLSQFVDRKVKVWGQTQNAEKVAWLMEVGKLEVLE